MTSPKAKQLRFSVVAIRTDRNSIYTVVVRFYLL